MNALSQLEGNAGKPIYQMSKWWARRRSSVFRAMLDCRCYASSCPQECRWFSRFLTQMAYPFRMRPKLRKPSGMLTTPITRKPVISNTSKSWIPSWEEEPRLVEGSRLGFQVAGVDLNPVAWFVAKNELACTDPRDSTAFFKELKTSSNLEFNRSMKPNARGDTLEDGIESRRVRDRNGR